MPHFLVFGIGPIPLEGSRLFHAGGNRAWHLTDALRSAGHRVTLLCMRVTSHDNPDREIHRLEQSDLTYVSVDEVTHFADDGFLREFVEQVKPDALVGACAYPAARAAAIAGDLPLWVDLHGYNMGEAQAKAFRDGEDGYRFHYLDRYRPALERGDRFSVTSEPHRHALIGELGILGRLNRFTFGEDLIHTIPIGWALVPVLRKPRRTASDPLIVYWSGGFNTWCDVETMVRGLNSAMDRDQRIRFLSTGGAIDGHDEKTYPEFLKRVESSPHRGRFDTRGWVPTEELPGIQEVADLGINVDRFCYETLIGARNRITEMMARGIPVLSTLGSEISHVLRREFLGLTAPIGEPGQLAEQMLWAADHPDDIQSMAHSAREFFERNYTYSATAKPLTDWAEEPVRSGDGGRGVPSLFPPPPAPLGIRGAARQLRCAIANRLSRRTKTGT